jgi:LPS export ABC transporter protein LptC
MRPFLIVFLLVLVAFEILILFPKATDKITEKAALTTEKIKDGTATKSNQIQQEAQGVHLVESQRGTRDWELFASLAKSYQNNPIWDLEGVRVLFYNQEVQTFELRGSKGKIDTQTKDMKIEGQVEIETANGYLFLAPAVEYKASERLIFCRQVVQVKGPLVGGKRSLFLRGLGMRIPVATGKMYLERDVEGEKVLSPEKLLRFRSLRAELSSQNQEARFIEQVNIDYEPMKMTSEEAVFSYNEKRKQFETLELKGKVQLTEENRRAVSENLRVDFNQKTFTFSGQPRLYQGEDELTGDQIIFLDNGKKVKVEKVRLKSQDGL